VLLGSISTGARAQTGTKRFGTNREQNKYDFRFPHEEQLDGERKDPSTQNLMHRAAAERIREQDFPAAEQAPDGEQGIRGLSDPAALAETGADSLPQDGKLNAGTKNRFGGNQKLDPAVTEPS
jgi:hypothetical protein